MVQLPGPGPNALVAVGTTSMATATLAATASTFPPAGPVIIICKRTHHAREWDRVRRGALMGELLSSLYNQNHYT